VPHVFHRSLNSREVLVRAAAADSQDISSLQAQSLQDPAVRRLGKDVFTTVGNDRNRFRSNPDVSAELGSGELRYRHGAECPATQLWVEQAIPEAERM
jgi:hypothetical protein